jgi:4-hydroxybenzoate polyprenyltransferase
MLPYNEEVLNYLREAQESGRAVWLVTAADRRIADAVAAHLGLFDRVIATDRAMNIKGKNKLAAIREAAGATMPFAYVGDHRSDLAVWEGASEKIGVFPEGKAPAWASNISFDRVLARRRRSRDLLRLMRPHQWLKNLLVFAPLFLSHQLTAVDKWINVGLGFVAFCCAASSVYIFNDLLDIEADRAHVEKSARPLAAGEVPIPTALVFATLLFILALGVALVVSPAYLGIIVCYMLVTSLYSYDLKRRLLVDVLCLAALYSLRIFAGGIAAEVEVSKWLLGFATFFFLSLGFAKRYAELYHQPEDVGTSKRRNYTREDMPAVSQAGLACGMVSVLVFVLYLQDSASEELYPHSEFLWLVAPLMLYWILRLWFHASRGGLHQDPVVFAITDRITRLIGVLVAALLWIASTHWF